MNCSESLSHKGADLLIGPALAFPLSGLDIGGDGCEFAVDGGSNRFCTSDACRGNQSDDQGILNQVLTFFAVHQVLHLNQELEIQCIHLGSPWDEIPSLGPGHPLISKLDAILEIQAHCLTYQSLNDSDPNRLGCHSVYAGIQNELDRPAKVYMIEKCDYG